MLLENVTCFKDSQIRDSLYVLVFCRMLFFGDAFGKLDVIKNGPKLVLRFLNLEL
jgi:hypothetical protein